MIKVCYIAPKGCANRANVNRTVLYSGGLVAGMFETVKEAFSEALQEAIVDPFNAWCHGLWLKFIDVSYVLCLSIAITGAICGMLGIKKGYQAALLSMMFYFLLNLVSWACGWN